ncbi:MAG: hypothetical protein BM563_07780 [Bacteroidetes bacterium MedPE-SWsnd-G1]|nr:MAG: hypothetical protein BM563_07780 [Bacteroidetes bacterium MedPE-SWsnd-G1]
MNFIKNAYSGKVEWWRYLVGTLIIFLAWQLVGVLPFMGAIGFKVARDGDLSVLENLTTESMMNIFEPNLTLFLMLISFAFGLVGVFIVCKYLHKQSLKSLTTARKEIDWKRVRFAFTLWGTVIVAMTALAYFMAPEDFIWNFKLEKFILLVIIGILLIPLQTSFEEYFFRGYLMQGLGVIAKNRWFPLIVTSVVFGMMHFWNPEVEKLGPIIMVYYIGTGLFLGIITLMDEGMELALGFHAANNLVAALLVTADWTVFQTHSILIDTSEPSVGFDILIPVVVIFPIVYLVFAKKYNWTNWRDKLIGKIN